MYRLFYCSFKALNSLPDDGPYIGSLSRFFSKRGERAFLS